MSTPATSIEALANQEYKWGFVTETRAVRVSEAELVTVALRRFHPGRPVHDAFGPLAALPGVTLVPTSGAMDAKEAVRAAPLGRELSCNPFVKLVKEGFFALPYMPADPVLAKRLEKADGAAVMPLGRAIGSGSGRAG
jgi:thiazole synthase